MSNKVCFSALKLGPAALAATILICLGLVFAATHTKAQAQSTETPRAVKSAPPRNLVVVETDVREKTIRFGDELVVLVTLQNHGTKPVRIPPAALILNNERWVQGGGSGSGLGEYPLVPTGAYGKEEITLQPGESLALTGASVDLGSHSRGSMKAEFVIKTEDEELRKELATRIASLPWNVQVHLANAEVQGGVASLYGWAASAIEKRAIEVVAENTPGVVKVRSCVHRAVPYV